MSAADGGSSPSSQSEGSPTVPAAIDESPSESPSEPVAEASADEGSSHAGSLAHTGLALGVLAGLGLACSRPD